MAILPQPSRDHAARHRPEHLSPFSPDRVEHDFIEEEEIIDLDDPAKNHIVERAGLKAAAGNNLTLQQYFGFSASPPGAGRAHTSEQYEEKNLMTMRIIRCGPENGKPPKIVCTGCGKRAAEAGCAIRPEDLETSHSSEGPILMIYDDVSYPLCEDCVTALERADRGESRFPGVADDPGPLVGSWSVVQDRDSRSAGPAVRPAVQPFE